VAPQNNIPHKPGAGSIRSDDVAITIDAADWVDELGDGAIKPTIGLRLALRENCHRQEHLLANHGTMLS
jgi:hypothetical protein